MKPKDIVTLLVLAAIWGASFMFIEVILRELAPITLAAFRIGLGALGLLVYLPVANFLAARREQGQVRVKVNWGRLIVPFFVVAVLNGVIPYLAISWGQTLISSGDAAILNATTPLFTAMVAFLLGSSAGVDQPTRGKALGVLVGFVGVAVLVSSSSPVAGVASSAALLGHGAVLVATLAYAVAGLYSRRAFVGLPPIVPAVGQMVVAALILLPPALLIAPPKGLLSLEPLLALLALGLGGTGLAYVLYYQLIARVGATRTAVVTYLLPGMALVYGALLLQEPITGQSILGLALVLLGIAITTDGVKTFVRGRLAARRNAV